MEEQTTGLNANAEPAANAETGMSEAADGFDAMFLQAFLGETAETGEAPTTGDAGDGTDGGGVETPEVPTTDEPDAAQSNPPDGDEQAAQSEADAGAEKQPTQPTKRELRLKVNHEDRTVDLNAMSDKDIIVLLQKGHAYDALKAASADAKNAEKFRAKCQQFIQDDGMSHDAARAMAAAFYGTKNYPVNIDDDGNVTLSDDYKPFPDFGEIETAPSAAPTPSAPTTAQAKANESASFDAEVKLAKAAFPGLREIPQEAVELRKLGMPLYHAILIVQSRETAQKAAATARANKTLQQNAEAARRAPVTGVSGGGNANANANPYAGLSQTQRAMLAGFEGRSIL